VISLMAARIWSQSWSPAARGGQRQRHPPGRRRAGSGQLPVEERTQRALGLADDLGAEGSILGHELGFTPVVGR
jgi:hypothetical protein